MPGVLKRWNGTTEQWEWAVGGAGMVPLQRFEADALGLADFDFASIPGTYAALHIVLLGRSDEVASQDGLRVQFNGDTSALYDHVRQVGTSSATSTVTTAATSGLLGYVAGNDDAADLAMGAYVIDLPHYANANFVGVAISTGGRNTALASGQDVERCQTYWRDSDPITRVRLFPELGQWMEGSSATLYGLRTP